MVLLRNEIHVDDDCMHCCIKMVTHINLSLALTYKALFVFCLSDTQGKTFCWRHLSFTQTPAAESYISTWKREAFLLRQRISDLAPSDFIPASHESPQRVIHPFEWWSDVIFSNGHLSVFCSERMRNLMLRWNKSPIIYVDSAERYIAHDLKDICAYR
jgi:hypothetical protein